LVPLEAHVRDRYLAVKNMNGFSVLNAVGKQVDPLVRQIVLVVGLPKKDIKRSMVRHVSL